MSLFEQFRPDVVFHAAALKQLPQLELDWAEGVKTNIFGSVNVVDATAAVGAAGVLISTDKAVDPVSGARRDQALFGNVRPARRCRARRTASAVPRLISVRFGNVLGSVGSVVPKFKAQIERGGPVTVTHPEMVRYFMTVREAVDLVISAAAHSASAAGAGATRASVYVLKMGQPARILDLAEKMIRLAGYEPRVDIDIVFTGARRGERLNEILFSGNEPVVDIGVDGVTAAQTCAGRSRRDDALARRTRQRRREGRSRRLRAHLQRGDPQFSRRRFGDRPQRAPGLARRHGRIARGHGTAGVRPASFRTSLRARERARTPAIPGAFALPARRDRYIDQGTTSARRGHSGDTHVP